MHARSRGRFRVFDSRPHYRRLDHMLVLTCNVDIIRGRHAAVAGAAGGKMQPAFTRVNYPARDSGKLTPHLA